MLYGTGYGSWWNPKISDVVTPDEDVSEGDNMANGFRFQPPYTGKHPVLIELEGASIIPPFPNVITSRGVQINPTWTDAAYPNYGASSIPLTDVDPTTFHKLSVTRLLANGVEYTRYDSVPQAIASRPGWAYDGYVLTVIEKEVLVDYCLSWNNGTTNYADETTDARDVGTADVLIRKDTDDALYFGHSSRVFNILNFAITNAVTGGTRVLEYWNGSAWTALSGVSALNGSVNFTSTGLNILRWTTPTDWVINAVGNTDEEISAYWIRSRQSVAGSGAGDGDIAYVTFDPKANTTLVYHPFYFSNYAKSFNGVQYKPLLLSKGSFEVSTTFLDFLLGAKQSELAAEVDLNNSGRDIDNLTKRYHFPTGKASIRVAAEAPNQEVDYSSYRLVFEGDILSVERRDEITSMQLSGNAPLHGRVLTEYVTTDVYPSAMDGEIGKEIPMFFGDTAYFVAGSNNEIRWNRGLPGLIVKRGSNPASTGWRKRRFKICRQIQNPFTGTYHSYTVNNVVRRNSDGTYDTISGANYNTSENGTLVTFTGTFELQDSDIVRFDISGPYDDSAGTFTGTASALIDEPLDIIHFLLVAVLGINPSKLDLSLFAKTGVTKSATAGTLSVDTTIYDTSQACYILKDEKYIDVIHNFLLSFRAYLETYPKYAVRLIANPLGDNSLLWEHLIDSKEKQAGTYAYDKVLVRYKQNAAEQSFKSRKHDERIVSSFQTKVSNAIDIQSGRSLFGKTEQLEIITYNTDGTKTQTLANRVARWIAKGLRDYSAVDMAGDMEHMKGGQSVWLRALRSMSGDLNTTKTQRACIIQKLIRDLFSGNTRFLLLEGE